MGYFVGLIIVMMVVAQSDANGEEQRPAADIKYNIHELHLGENYCSYDGSSLSDTAVTLDPDQKTMKLFEMILDLAGYRGGERNFILHASNVKNAAAVLEGGRRHILYNQLFLDQLTTAIASKAGAIGVLAHEIGHHKLGHTLGRGNKELRYLDEVAADRFAGAILQQSLGASLKDAMQTIERVASEKATETHPDRKTRIDSLVNGWMAAEEGQKLVSLLKTQVVANAAAQKKPSSGSIPRISIKGEPSDVYYVLSGSNIVTIAPEGKVVWAGQKLMTKNTDYEWMGKIGTKEYGIDKEGSVFSLFHGIPTKAGEVTYLPKK